MYFTISFQGVTIRSEKEIKKNDQVTDSICEKEAIFMKKFFEHLEEVLEDYYKTFAKETETSKNGRGVFHCPFFMQKDHSLLVFICARITPANTSMHPIVSFVLRI